MKCMIPILLFVLVAGVSMAQGSKPLNGTAGMVSASSPDGISNTWFTKSGDGGSKKISVISSGKYGSTIVEESGSSKALSQRWIKQKERIALIDGHGKEVKAINAREWQVNDPIPEIIGINRRYITSETGGHILIIEYNGYQYNHLLV